jgi:hypothetical protein
MMNWNAVYMKRYGLYLLNKEELKCLVSGIIADAK